MEIYFFYLLLHKKNEVCVRSPVGLPPRCVCQESLPAVRSKSNSKSLAKFHSLYSHLAIHLTKISSSNFGTIQQTLQISSPYSVFILATSPPPTSSAQSLPHRRGSAEHHANSSLLPLHGASPPPRLPSSSTLGWIPLFLQLGSRSRASRDSSPSLFM